MTRRTIGNKGVATIEEPREACIEAEVKRVTCHMTVDLFGYTKEQFIPEITEWVGAASFLPRAQRGDVNLFI